MKKNGKPKKITKNSRTKTEDPAGKKLQPESEDDSILRRLRKNAEAHLGHNPEVLDKLNRQDMEQTLHELGTYQIELEMQNAQLREAQQELEESRRRLADRYDFAPVGYFSLDRDGKILSVNLTGASMLGMAKNELVHQSFSRFVDKKDVDRFYKGVEK